MKQQNLPKTPGEIPDDAPTNKKTLIVHNETLTRLGLLQLIGTIARFVICANTGDAPTAREFFVRYRPQVVVLGLTLQRGDGVQLIKDFRRLDPEVVIVVLSGARDALSIQRAFHAGARGYSVLQDSAEEILRALDETVRGHLYVSPKIIPQLLKTLASTRFDSVAPEKNLLSDRELHVVALIGQGLGASQLALELQVSVKTVETYQMRIKDKLGLHSAAALKEKATLWSVESARQRLRVLSPVPGHSPRAA